MSDSIVPLCIFASGFMIVKNGFPPERIIPSPGGQLVTPLA